MPTWNLHIVGQKAIEDVGAVAQDIVTALEDKGHELVSATLTTDEGTQPVAVAPPAEAAPAETPAEPETPAEETTDVSADTPPSLPDTPTVA